MLAPHQQRPFEHAEFLFDEGTLGSVVYNVELRSLDAWTLFFACLLRCGLQSRVHPLRPATSLQVVGDSWATGKHSIIGGQWGYLVLFYVFSNNRVGKMGGGFKAPWHTVFYMSYPKQDIVNND